MILVVNRGQDHADNLKALIEFMDTPDVVTADPDGWRARLGDEPLDALFVGADLSQDDISALLSDVGDIDPNVPIVLLQEDGAS